LQIDKQQGVVIRKIGTSGWNVRSISSTENYLFILFYDGNTLQLTMEMNYVAYCKSNGKVIPTSKIKYSKNNIFAYQPLTLVTFNCPATIQLLQFKVSDIVETAVYSLSKNNAGTLIPKLSITNYDEPSPNLITLLLTLNNLTEFKRPYHTIPFLRQSRLRWNI
jgi:hypothetical protein